MWDLSSPTRDGTHIPYLARWILNRWTTKEVLRMTFKLIRGLELWHEEDLDLNPASTAFCGGGRDRGLCDLEHGTEPLRTSVSFSVNLVTVRIPRN